MCCCDDNPQICGGSVVRKARKPHKCEECGRVIAKGERYKEYSGLWHDVGFQTYRWCAHCEAGQKVASERTKEYCWCFGMLWEGVDEENRGWGGRRDRTLCRLVIGARRQWMYQRGPRKGQLVPVPKAVPVAMERGLA